MTKKMTNYLKYYDLIYIMNFLRIFFHASIGGILTLFLLLKRKTKEKNAVA